MKKLYLLLVLPLVALLLCAKCEKEEIAAALPAAARDYIEQHYPGAEIEETVREKDCGGAEVLEVEVEPSENTEIELVFDLSGNLLYKETEIEVSTLPAAVANVIASQFSGYSIKEAERLDLADGSTRYETSLKKSGDSLDVVFDAEGTELCREQD